MQAKISVIVPVYNGRDCIERCLHSITSQTYPNLEVLVIDDGSTDGSAELLDTIAAKDERIRVFHIPNGGVSGARNFGLDRAEGEYLTFVDCDDYIDRTMLEEMLSLMAEDVDMVQCGYRMVSEDGEDLGGSTNPPLDLSGTRNVLIEFFKVNLYQCCWAKLYRTSLLDGLRFETKYQVGEDDLFSYGFCRKAKRVLATTAPLYQYVFNEDSVMNKDLKEKHFQILSVYETQLAECKGDKLLCSLCAAKEIKTVHSLLYRIFVTGAMEEKLPLLQKRIKKHARVWLTSPLFSVKDKLAFFLFALSPRLFTKLKKPSA